MKSKIIFIEYLRVIAAIAVVLVHTAAELSFGYDQIPHSQWWAANLISSANHWAVPIFILISGYLLLAPHKYRKNKNFYLARFKRVGLPLLVWTLIYAVYHHFSRQDPLSITFISKRLIFDQPYEHLYFLIILLELAFITPLIKKLLKSLSPQQFDQLIFILILVSILWKPRRFVGLLFVPYLSFYIGGYWFRVKKFYLKARLFYLNSISLVSFIALGTYLLVSHSSPARDGLYFYTYVNPLIILFSSLIFIFFQNQDKKLSSHWLVSKISATTLGVYLIHPLILNLFNFINIPDRFLPALAIIIIKASLVFLGSVAITALYQSLKLAILRRWNFQLIKDKL